MILIDIYRWASSKVYSAISYGQLVLVIIWPGGCSHQGFGSGWVLPEYGSNLREKKTGSELREKSGSGSDHRKNPRPDLDPNLYTLKLAFYFFLST